MTCVWPWGDLHGWLDVTEIRGINQPPGLYTIWLSTYSKVWRKKKLAVKSWWNTMMQFSLQSWLIIFSVFFLFLIREIDVLLWTFSIPPNTETLLWASFLSTVMFWNCSFLSYVLKILFKLFFFWGHTTIQITLCFNSCMCEDGLSLLMYIYWCISDPEVFILQRRNKDYAMIFDGKQITYWQSQIMQLMWYVVGHVLYIFVRK